MRQRGNVRVNGISMHHKSRNILTEVAREVLKVEVMASAK